MLKTLNYSSSYFGNCFEVVDKFLGNVNSDKRSTLHLLDFFYLKSVQFKISSEKFLIVKLQ
jgi:hypothetical protein